MIVVVKASDPHAKYTGAKADHLGSAKLADFATLAVPIAAAQMPMTVYLPVIYS